MTNKFTIRCDEATTICDKNQYGEASSWDKIRLHWHLLLCKHCKTYTEQNQIITKILGKSLGSCNDPKQLSFKEKQALEKKIKKQLEK